MITEQLRSYIDMCNEEVRVNNETDNMLYEMARVDIRRHGIEGVVIWVGEANKQHGLRVKVSNLRNRWSDDSFVIQMPSLDYDPSQVANWIDKTKMQQILEWIKLNQDVLYDFENGLITVTDDFYDRLSKIK
jgi:hypothetical protein